MDDGIEILEGTLRDQNDNGVLDVCECLGDVNRDGLVGSEDLTILLQNFGSGPGGDIDSDGDTDLDDLVLLLQNFGTVCT